MKKVVIFDLDGTLLNTIADLAASTNHALAALQFPTHPVAAYPLMVGNGIDKLFERALPEGSQTAENRWHLRELFEAHYEQHNTEASSPYPGIPELLQSLQQQQIQLAIASNKYQEATEKLAAHFFPNIRFTAVLGAREGVALKPDPAIVFEILQRAGVAQEEALFVGDSGVDMQTALHAGVAACGVTWGFRGRKELEAFQPDCIVDRAAEIEQLL